MRDRTPNRTVREPLLCCAKKTQKPMEERAVKRRATEAQGGGDKGKEEEEEEKKEEEEAEEYDILFRSYVPRDVKLQRCKRPQTSVPDMVGDISARVAALTSASRREDILSLAPKKAAWDLARDLQPKIARLSHLTDRAIVEMLKQQQQHNKALQ